jgi:hypothetical protein
MTNELIPYYQSQAGSGISGFQGIKYQRGHGFFGRLLAKAIYPLLRFFGKQALNTGINVATDVIKDKRNFKQSLKTRGRETGQNILEAGLKRAQRFQQTGEGGGKRRRKTRKRKNVNKSSKKDNRKRKAKAIKRQKRRSKKVLETLF